MLIHRYWNGPDDPPHEPWLNHVLHQLNPGIEIRDWTPESLPFDYLPVTDQVRKRDWLKHEANVTRLQLLIEFGGAWYDHDVVPLLPLASLPFPSVGSHRGLCNSFMYFQKEDERLIRALDTIKKKPPSSYPSTIVSGSVFLRPFMVGVHYLEFPFSPDGELLHGNRPFAIHLG